MIAPDAQSFLCDHHFIETKEVHMTFAYVCPDRHVLVVFYEDDSRAEFALTSADDAHIRFLMGV